MLSPRLIVMRMHNLYGTEKEKEGEESSEEDSDEDEEDEDKTPQMELAMLPHYGGINRVRVCYLPFLIHRLLCQKLNVPYLENVFWFFIFR